MKITNVRTLTMGTPWRDLTFAVVETDDGLRGVAEARMLNRTEGLLGYLGEAVPRYVLGQDPFNQEKIVRSMYLGDFGRVGEIVMTAIALIETACWDIVGKALNQPVYRLMGGAVRDRIKAYANGWYTVERTPEEFAKAARRVVERGYKAAKLDPFGGGFYELERSEKLRSIALVEAVRATVGPDFDILIEMHGRFNPATAIEIARELEPFQPGWLEEPVPPENLRALKKVAEAVRSPVGTAAVLHLDAGMPNFKIQEHFNDFADAWVKQAVDVYPEVVDGYFSLPERPGLGVELREDFIAEHPRQKAHFNLYAEDWHKRQASKQ
ncbi:MAG TPA: mandelate racemase/muconate lactonizing enzyme family protein [Bryobacteraceae bacterium]|nr:mandelate racemase/muconate lactonizing enzyme family protein [Bryobacteraceae bacterium]